MNVRSRNPAVGTARMSANTQETWSSTYVKAVSARYGRAEVAMSSMLRPASGSRTAPSARARTKAPGAAGSDAEGVTARSWAQSRSQSSAAIPPHPRPSTATFRGATSRGASGLLEHQAVVVHQLPLEAHAVGAPPGGEREPEVESVSHRGISRSFSSAMPGFQLRFACPTAGSSRCSRAGRSRSIRGGNGAPHSDDLLLTERKEGAGKRQPASSPGTTRPNRAARCRSTSSTGIMFRPNTMVCR